MDFNVINGIAVGYLCIIKKIVNVGNSDITLLPGYYVGRICHMITIRQIALAYEIRIPYIVTFCNIGCSLSKCTQP